MNFQDGRIGQDVQYFNAVGVIATIDAADYLFFVQFPDRATWVVPEYCEPVQYDDPLKYLPGVNGWIPDRMRADIDVLRVTEELVAWEVGK